MAIIFRPDPEPVASPSPVGVGQDLRAAREATGKSIGECADALRIRQPFLQALEDGRLKDLPGGTYAIGFLRTYAEYLGLDGEEMVRRFRLEASGDLVARSELVFPSPMSEGRVPTGGLLFVGLVVAVLAYGAWYLMTSPEDQLADSAPVVPERLTTALNRPAQVVGEVKPVESENAKPDENAQSSAQGEGKEAKDQPAPSPAAEPDKPVAVAATSEPPKVEAPKSEPPKPEILKSEPAKPEPVKPEAPKPEAPKVEASKPDSAQIGAGVAYGSDSPEARVLVRVIGEDCWVQVREMDGQIQASRLLRKGDSYRVPNRPGQLLTVGNAAAVELVVDGRASGPLGKPGQVLHDIKLDPGRGG